MKNLGLALPDHRAWNSSIVVPQEFTEFLEDSHSPRPGLRARRLVGDVCINRHRESCFPPRLLLEFEPSGKSASFSCWAGKSYPTD